MVCVPTRPELAFHSAGSSLNYPMQAFLFNIGNHETHLTLVPIRQIFRRFSNSMPATKLSTAPARLASTIGQQTTLANTLRGKHLIFPQTASTFTSTGQYH